MNTAMLGAFAKATGLITIEGVEAGIMEVFGRRLSKEIADRNVAAARAAYDTTRLGEADSGRMYPKASKWLPTAQEMPPGLATPALETPFGRVGVGSSGTNRTGGWRVEKPILDGTKCTNCLLCWFYCPDGSIVRGPKIVEIHYDYCKGCGVCAAVCAPKAIHMERELEEEVKA